ncbi:ABC transporter permease [Bradyrhizobium iriomotense]|uniref:Sugar ABC transporter permease n=1 Tax=Bradyrhizobium iriomotense TaxID=441950 RepID=A0ABQ6BA63_9BRAD|nr:ABC transporter permease [Bradyrhizobium iriomotense]GLR91257.1 sugar ABC transporter permease [Bradyrhizobium iriomotense]
MENRIQAAASEIVRQSAQFDRWGTLALMDISLRYRRTVIGPLWITLTLAATIASVGTVYATLFKQDVAVFLPSFAVGLIVWTLIAATLQEGSNVFVASGHLIKAVPAPLIVHVLQMTARNVVIFLHHLLLVVLLYVVMPWPLHWTLLLAVPGFAILLVTLVGAATALGLLCARFRDIGSAIVSGLQFVFFLTPIIWTEDAVRGTAFHWLTRVNPFATLLDLVRKPLLSQATDPEQWLLGSVYAVGMAMIGLGCYARYRHRVAYWL